MNSSEGKHLQLNVSTGDNVTANHPKQHDDTASVNAHAHAQQETENSGDKLVPTLRGRSSKLLMSGGLRQSRLQSNG